MPFRRAIWHEKIEMPPGREAGEELVLRGGKFGRTTTAQATDGRNRDNRGFTMWISGGSVRGGRRFGRDIHWDSIYRYSGRDMRLTDVYGNVVKDILA